MKKGFTLFEMLVVLSCSMVVIMSGLYLCESWIKTVYTSQARADEAVQLYRALLLIMRDVRCAQTTEAIAWRIGNDMLSIPCGQSIITYRLKGDALIRKHGRGQSLVARGVVRMTVTLDGIQVVRGITGTLVGKYRTYSVYCAAGAV